ncbi:MAG TPA: ribose ABC transporter permease [Anaerolineales bacterium]|nr:ribose ABC transporter permease [Anaerolineales bacterium]
MATQTEPISPGRMKQKEFSLASFFRFLLDQRSFIVLIVLCLVISYLIPSFATTKNLLNVLRQVSITGIVAVGMTFIIITGGIDISVGSIVALSGVVVASALKMGVSIPVAIIAGLLAGCAVGLLNGVIISYGRVLPFVATLGTMYLIRGSALLVTNGQAMWDLPKSFLHIGTGYILGIPIPVIITLVIYLSGHFLLRNFTFGRYVLALGGDEESARLCGVAVRRVKLYTYVLGGLLTSLAGIVLAARLGSGQPSTGDGYELTAIAAAVIGGNSLSGGRGTVLGTLIGALILGVVSNALNLWGVASFWQTIISGTIVLIAVLADTLRKRRTR